MTCFHPIRSRGKINEAQLVIRDARGIFEVGEEGGGKMVLFVLKPFMLHIIFIVYHTVILVKEYQDYISLRD